MMTLAIRRLVEQMLIALKASAVVFLNSKATLTQNAVRSVFRVRNAIEIRLALIINAKIHAQARVHPMLCVMW